MPNQIELPQDKDLAGKVLDAHSHQQIRRQEMGWIGVCFGGEQEKAGNIAGAAIIISFLLLMLVLLLGPNSTEFPKKEAMTLFGSIISGALGFLFGRNTK